MLAPTRESQLKALIRRRYARGQTDGYARARQAGYSAETLSRAPRTLVDGWSGCGNLAGCVSLDGAELVADLGCGSGLDAFLIANAPHPPKTVVALDLTPEALPKISGVTALAGDMEALPLADCCCDLVIANASFNLALDRRQAFSEAARILRPGGRLHACDLMRTDDPEPELLVDPMGHGTSLGGVTDEWSLRAEMEAAGFSDIRIHSHRPFASVVAVQIEAGVSVS